MSIVKNTRHISKKAHFSLIFVNKFINFYDATIALLFHYYTYELLNIAQRQFKHIEQGCFAMNYLERITRNIKRDFPDITPEELQERLTLIKHLIAFQHQKEKALRKELN